MIIILKDTPEVGETQCRKAGNLRILSLSNTDQKIMSTAVSIPFANLATVSCDAAQSGGMRGRRLDDCLLGAEAKAIVAST